MPVRSSGERQFLIGASVAIATVTALFSFRDFQAANSLVEIASQAADRAVQATEVLSALRDAETLQRGYILTDQRDYLDRYLSSVPHVRKLIESFRAARIPRADLPVQLHIASLATEKLEELSTTMNLQRGGDTLQALATVRTNRGKQLMDDILRGTEILISSDNVERAEADGRARFHKLRGVSIIVAGTLSLVVLLILAVLRLSKATKELSLARRRALDERTTFETTLRSIGDAVIATDSASVVTFLNPVAESLTGWPADKAVGRPLSATFTIVNESSREPVEDPTAKVLRLGAIGGLAGRTFLISRDGREIPIDDCAAPVRDAAGNLTGAVLVFRDVTERRRAEQKIEDAAYRYRLLFENSPQPMWVFDVSTLAFLAVNKAAIQSYGYSRDEFLTMTIKDIRPAEDVPRLLDEVRSIPQDVHSSGTWRHRKKNGAYMDVEIVSQPTEFRGRQSRLVLATDVTERRRLEQQFHQGQRLESVGRLAGGVAHDFNNLLTVIGGYTDLVLGQLPPGSPYRDSLNQVLSARDRAASLTQQLLAFSRRQLIQPTVLNVNEILVGLEKMLRRIIGEDIRLSVELDPALDNVKAGVSQVEQVVLNLAVNAREAMPEGGSLVLETANVVLDAAYLESRPSVQAGRYVMLAVGDTGSGMSPEVREHIFEPFFTTKPAGSGTGLGLATVYGIVKQFGGWIWVYSEPGSGSTFKIYLPSTTEPVKTISPVRESDLRGHETILIVEDQADVRGLAELTLKQFGYRVISAASSEEALSLLGSFPDHIHLLLTDLVMPGMQGHQLAARVVSERPGLRVLFMSGYTESGISHRAVLEAGSFFLQKPFTTEALGAKVREVLASAKRATVLVVDDDDATRALFRHILSAVGYTVLEAANGKQALAVIRNHSELTLVLTDLVMPEMEGIEFIRKIRSDYPYIQVIAVSGAFGGDFLRPAELLGAIKTLRKPVERQDLLRVVAEAAASSAANVPGNLEA